MNKLAIITGAGSGIGSALALEFCKAGIRVLGVGRRAEALERTHDKIRETGLSGFSALAVDVATEAGRRAIKAHVPSDSQIHYLTLLAGVFPIDRLEKVTLDSWRQTFAVHVEARLFLTQLLLDRLAQGSRILFAKSGGSEKPRVGCIEVCASGAASLMVQKCMAKELRGRDILVSTTRPGFVRTEMMDSALRATVEQMPDIDAIRATPMIDSSTCGKYMYWLLTETSDEEFMRDNWNIEDPSHHSRWLEGTSLHEEAS